MNRLGTIAAICLGTVAAHAAHAAAPRVRINIGAATPRAVTELSALAIEEFGAAPVRRLDRLDVATLLVPRSELEQLIGHPQVEELADYLDVDRRASIPEIVAGGAGPSDGPDAAAGPDDPDYSDQWGPACVQLDRAWERVGFLHTEARLAIVDSGIDLDHPDLAPHVLVAEGWDFVNERATAEDDNGHGTHCAGIAAAVIDNGVGVAGVINGKLIPVKVLDHSGAGWWSDVAAGVDWAVEHGADVISMSLGGGRDRTVERALQRAADAGVLIFAAAGNHGNSSKVYPASFTEAIGVGALASCGRIALYSGRGFGDHTRSGNVEIVAPGSNIYSTYLDGGYRSLSGTSMATPLAAAIGLAYVELTRWDAADIRSHIQRSADPIGGESNYGYGRVDAWPIWD